MRNEGPQSPVTAQPCECDHISSPRRAFLKSTAGLAAAGAISTRMATDAFAQETGAAQSDAELARVQGARRVLLRGGVVMSLDRRIGDFAQADVLIEDGKIRDVRPGIAVSGDTAVIDAVNRIVIPGFIDTHCHSYQGLLRDIMPNGLLSPDYNRDVQSTLTPVYQPEDAYAGELANALGMIDSGTTTIVDISQVSHTPEHSDACIRALQEAGIRAVFSYHRGAGPGARYPQDITRLQRTYFNSKDQLLTLALTTGLDAKLYAVAREAGVPAVLHLVGKDLSAPLLELPCIAGIRRHS
jgi:cytosine/adenosine deaminase-related metal-dependent hydrolase